MQSASRNLYELISEAPDAKIKLEMLIHEWFYDCTIIIILMAQEPKYQSIEARIEILRSRPLRSAPHWLNLFIYDAPDAWKDLQKLKAKGFITM